MRKIFWMMLVGFLAACAEGETVTRPVLVEVPVVRPCLGREVEKPPRYFTELPKNHSLFEGVRALLAERELRDAYEIEVEAELRACKAKEHY